MRYCRHGRGSVLRQSSSLLLLDCLSPLSPRQNDNPKRRLTRLIDMEWTLTRRIDLADPQAIGAFVLEVEETRISISPTGVEHREIRWRRATLPEAKMVLESYHAQRTSRRQGLSRPLFLLGRSEVNGQAESVETELKDVGNGQDVTLVPQDVTR